MLAERRCPLDYEKVVLKRWILNGSPRKAWGFPQVDSEFLDELYRYGIEMHSFMLLQPWQSPCGGLVEALYAGLSHIMFSFSKSLTSTAIGFAEQGSACSAWTTAWWISSRKRFREPQRKSEKATVRHLLMMGCGHESEIPNMGDRRPDWISAFSCPSLRV